MGTYGNAHCPGDAVSSLGFTYTHHARLTEGHIADSGKLSGLGVVVVVVLYNSYIGTICLSDARRRREAAAV